MFYGEYEHSIDRKGRIVLPAKFREVAKNHFVEKFYVTRGLDGCLFMLAEEEWKSQEQKFKSSPFTRSDSRKFNRLYFSGACEVAADKQGRILLPQYLKEYAQIKRDLILIGVSNRIEIWAKEKWKEFYSAHKDSFEEISEKLVGENE